MIKRKCLARRIEKMSEEEIKTLKSMKEAATKSIQKPYSRIDQIGIVVKDVEKTIKFFQETFGIGPFVTTETEEEGGTIKISLFQLGELQIELIQNSVMGRVKEGLHHLAFYVENIEKELAKLKKHGIGVLQRGNVLGLVEWAYLDTEKNSGIIFELLQLTPLVDEILKGSS